MQEDLPVLLAKQEEKRLFFALEVVAPWPEKLPSGRILKDDARHMTIAFLGKTNYSRLKELLPSVPKPPHKVGIVGKFDDILFLPKHHPRVVAWHIHWLENCDPLLEYQKQLVAWLKANGFNPDVRHETFLPHVTLSRAPFNFKEWRYAFSPIPLMITDLHLYESLGNMRYQPCWSHPIKLPFQEIAHTADIAFCIRGENLQQIHRHAQIALAFKFPPFLPFFSDKEEFESLDEVIILLNETLSHADQKIGIPFKAVSFHGELEKEEDDLLKWEMIVDV